MCVDKVSMWVHDDNPSKQSSREKLLFFLTEMTKELDFVYFFLQILQY